MKIETCNPLTGKEILVAKINRRKDKFSKLVRIKGFEVLVIGLKDGNTAQLIYVSPDMCHVIDMLNMKLIERSETFGLVSVCMKHSKATILIETTFAGITVEIVCHASNEIIGEKRYLKVSPVYILPNEELMKLMEYR